MKVVAFVPIKLNSQRLPHKNILPIAGHPLCWHLCNTLLKVNNIDEVYDNLIIDLFSIEVCNGNSIEEHNEKISKLNQDIAKLEIKRDKEVQFNKKVKYNNDINRIKEEIKKIKREI